MNSESAPSAETPAEVVVLCSDLMLTSQIDGAARQNEITLADAGDVSGVLSRIGEPTNVLVVDLDTPGLNCEELTEGLGQNRPRLIGVYPHVRTDLHEAGERAGFDEIISRGSFVSQLPDILLGGRDN